MKWISQSGGSFGFHISYSETYIYVLRNTVKFLNMDFIKAVRGGGVTILWNIFIKLRFFWQWLPLVFNVIDYGINLDASIQFIGRAKLFLALSIHIEGNNLGMHFRLRQGRNWFVYLQFQNTFLKRKCCWGNTNLQNLVSSPRILFQLPSHDSISAREWCHVAM